MKKVLSADVLVQFGLYAFGAPHKMILESILVKKRMRVFNCSLSASQWKSSLNMASSITMIKIVEEDPLDFLNRITVKTKTSEELPFNGGAIGFVAMT